MKTLISFLRNSGIFIVGSVLTKLIGFLMLPLYTAWIAPEDLGYYDVSLAYLAIACEAVFLNIWVVILRFMYDGEEGEKPRAFAGGMVLFGASTLVYLAIAVGAWAIFDPPYFWLIITYGLMQNVSTVFKFVARGYGRNIDFAISGIIGSVSMALLNVLLILVFNYGIGALYVSIIAGFVLEITYLEIRVGVLRRALRGRPWGLSRTFVGGMFRYALPIGLNALCYWFIQSYNRVVISQELSLHDNGVFSVAARFGGIVVLATVAMTYAWQEIAFREANQNGRFLGRASSLYLVGLITLVSVMLPFVRAGFDLMIDPAYDAALYVVPSAVLLGVASGYSNFVINIFYGLKVSKTVLWTLLASALVNVVTIRFFVHWWGLHGANLSAVLAFVVNVVLLHIVLVRRVQFQFSYWVSLLGVIVGAVTGTVYFFVGSIGNLIYGGVLCALILAVVGVVFLRYRQGRRQADWPYN